MNILIIGCGKVGASLASKLNDMGHDVSIVDKDETRFELLTKNFTGFMTCGVPIDQDVLRRAGIENCDALAAVSDDDNVNIMASEVAKEIFKVPIVIARIYDLKRKDVFSHFGLHTVCPTNLTVAAVCSSIIQNEIPQIINIGDKTINFTTEIVPKSLYGTLASDIMLNENQSIYAILHLDNNLTFYQGQKIALLAGDKIILSNFVD